MPLLIAHLFSIIPITNLEGKPLSVSLKAGSAILVDLDTGTILYAKDEHKKTFPASTTKVATALYVLERKGHQLDQVVQASHTALATISSNEKFANLHKHPPYRLEYGGTHANLRIKEKQTLLTLLYGMMLASGNDASNVLAEAISGTIDQFMKELNAFLKSHGIVNTQFVNPHGLHHPDHWTTAYDLAQMTRLAFKHPTFREIVKSVRYLKPQGDSQSNYYFIQHNRLLKPGSFYYSKAIGVKTGFTSHARHNLVSAATHEGRTLIAVVLNCPDRGDPFSDSIKLFEAAFSEKKVSRILFAKSSDVFTHPLKGVSTQLKAVLKDDLLIEYYPSQEPIFRAEIHWQHQKLPIQSGETVGYLRCIDKRGALLSEKPLVAMEAINKPILLGIKEAIQTHKVLILALFLGAQVIISLVYFFKKHQKVR